jgi:hypothetical protein
MIKYRITHHKSYHSLYNVQRKFWFGWWTVASCLYLKEAETCVNNRINPIVKEY